MHPAKQEVLLLPSLAVLAFLQAGFLQAHHDGAVTSTKLPHSCKGQEKETTTKWVALLLSLWGKGLMLSSLGSDSEKRVGDNGWDFALKYHEGRKHQFLLLPTFLWNSVSPPAPWMFPQKRRPSSSWVWTCVHRQWKEQSVSWAQLRTLSQNPCDYGTNLG